MVYIFNYRFRLELFGLIVIASFLSSLFNIVRAIMTAAVFWILHRNQVDVPFTVTLEWRQKLSANTPSSKSQSNLDPFSKCGRRKKLAKLFSKIPVKGETLKFEILSSTEQSSGCLLSGVFVSEQSIGAESEDDLFSEFVGKRTEIENAVMEAFKLNDFVSQWHFDISIARSSKTSPRQRFRLTMEALQYFNVSEAVVATVESEMERTIVERSKSKPKAKVDSSDVVPEENGSKTTKTAVCI